MSVRSQFFVGGNVHNLELLRVQSRVGNSRDQAKLRELAMNDALTGVYSRSYLFDFLRKEVKVSSRRGAIEIKATPSERVVAGSVFIPFHFAEAAANMLTNEALDPTSKIPEYKVSACRIEKR